MVLRQADPIVVRLYSRSKPIVKAVDQLCEKHEFVLEVNSGPRPESPMFTVTTTEHSRDTHRLPWKWSAPAARVEWVYLPEAAVYLATSIIYARGAVLCGSDHWFCNPDDKRAQGVLF